MYPPVLAPDATLWATRYLRTALAARPEPYCSGVFVADKVPDQRRDRMVIIRRDGGRPDRLVDNPRLSFRIWAKTEQDASDLARMVVALLWAAPDGNPVVSVTPESGPSPVSDESGQPLRYLVMSFRTVGVQL